MLASSSSFVNEGRLPRFFAWSLVLGFAALVSVVSAQSQTSGQNPAPNGPVIITPDATAPAPSAAQPAPPPDAWDRFWKIEKVSDDEWVHHFRLGAIAGLNISANFKEKGVFNINGNNAANGIYDDGYVRIDNTGNAGGYTGYWGYNNASQYDANKQTLTFQSATAYTVNYNTNINGSGFAGAEMAYGGNLLKWADTRIGWDFGLGVLPINITDRNPMSATVNKTYYTFSTAGIVVPTAPYQGGPGGVGEPTILTNYTTSTSVSTETITGSRNLDVILFTLRLGPTLYWDLNEDFGLMIGGGPALGIVSGSLRYDEIIGSSTTSKGKVDGTDVVYGWYANAMLTYHVEKGGDLYVGAQYMPLGNATISGGGREARLNLRGQVYVTAGVNWTF